MSYNSYNLAAALMGFGVSFADRLFTLSTQGLSPLAVYNVAIVATNIASSISYALVTVMLPAAAGLFAASKLEELHRLLRLTARYVSILVMPIAFGLAAVVEIPLRIFGADYLSGTGPAMIVCIASGLTAISAIYASAIIALDKMRWFTAANLLGLAGFYVFTTALTPFFGISGPAFGRAALMIITTLVYGWAAFRAGVFELDHRAYLVSIICSTIVSIPVFTALLLLQAFYLKIVALPFLIVFAGLTYLCLLRLSHIISIDDLEFIRDVIPRPLHRFLPIIARIVGT